MTGMKLTSIVYDIVATALPLVCVLPTDTGTASVSCFKNDGSEPPRLFELPLTLELITRRYCRVLRIR